MIQQTDEQKKIYQRMYQTAQRQAYVYGLAVKGEGIVSNNGDFMTDDINVYKKIQEKFSQFDGDWWAELSEYSSKYQFPEMHSLQKELLLTHFLPLYANKPSVLFDLACADGEWTALMAEHVDRVDGYEYSSKMVEVAKKKYLNRKNASENLTFSQADAVSMQIPHIYDGGVCLGLLTTLSQNASNVVLNLHRMIRPGGYLATRDTLGVFFEAPLYFLNYLTGYSATYYDIESYAKMFLDAGFQLVYDKILDRVIDSGKVEFIRWGAIWKRV